MYKIFGYNPPPPAPKLPDWLDQLPFPDATTTGLSEKIQPPPTDAERASELPLVKELQALRSDAHDGWAKYMDHEGSTTMWKGPARDARKALGFLRGNLAKYLTYQTMALSVPGMRIGQPKYDLPRPVEMDPEVQELVPKPSTSSYPSGHTRLAFAAARIVSHFDPSQSEKVYDLARQVAISRIYGGAHLPSDVLEGARFGTAFADGVLRSWGETPGQAAVAASADEAMEAAQNGAAA